MLAIVNIFEDCGRQATSMFSMVYKVYGRRIPFSSINPITRPTLLCSVCGLFAFMPE
jgi:hypothetical protein